MGLKINQILSLIFVLVFTSAFSQTKSQNSERQENRVDTLYTHEEKANIITWVYDEVNKMNLDEKTRDSYSIILNNSSAKISRLDDKDQNYTDAERKEAFDKILQDMHEKVKPILNKEQFEIHTQYFTKIEKSIYERYGWDWTKD